MKYVEFREGSRNESARKRIDRNQKKRNGQNRKNPKVRVLKKAVEARNFKPNPHMHICMHFQIFIFFLYFIPFHILSLSLNNTKTQFTSQLHQLITYLCIYYHRHCHQTTYSFRETRFDLVDLNWERTKLYVHELLLAHFNTSQKIFVMVPN